MRVFLDGFYIINRKTIHLCCFSMFLRVTIYIWVALQGLEHAEDTDQQKRLDPSWTIGGLCFHISVLVYVLVKKLHKIIVLKCWIAVIQKQWASHGFSCQPYNVALSTDLGHNYLKKSNVRIKNALGWYTVIWFLKCSEVSICITNPVSFGPYLLDLFWLCLCITMESIAPTVNLGWIQLQSFATEQATDFSEPPFQAHRQWVFDT